MGDKRRLKRENTIFYLETLDGSTEKTLGRLIDVTGEGVMLMSESPIEPGTRHLLRIKLPREIARASQVEFEAECRWSRKSVNEDYFDSGFRITQASEKDRDLIDLLIKFFSFSG